MPTSLSASHDVPVTVEEAFAALSGQQWPPALDAALHDGSTLVERTELPDGGVRLVSRRRLPDGIPGFLLRFAPKDGTVTQTDVWGPATGGVRSGTWQVEFPGAPGSIAGTTRVEPAGDGARWVVDGAVHVKVPLVGGKAEGFLAPLIAKLVGKQADVLRGLVAPQP